MARARPRSSSQSQRRTQPAPRYEPASYSYSDHEDERYYCDDEESSYHTQDRVPYEVLPQHSALLASSTAYPTSLELAQYGALY